MLTFVINSEMLFSMKPLVLTAKQYSKKFPKVKPAGRHVSVPDDRFRIPCHFQISNPGWKLCHGWISTENGSERHAWVEQKGFVLDLWYDIRISASKYYQVFKCRKVRKYSKTQARACMTKYRTYQFPVEEEEEK